MQDSHRQITFLLIGIFTLLQLLCLVLFGYTPYPDSDGYIQIAEECVAQGEPYPLVSKLNNYPFLWNIGAINSVAFSLWLFHSIKPLLVIYCIIKGATAWCFYQLTKTLIDHRTALIALFIYMLYPANYGEATSALSELPFMFFIMSGLWLCISKKQYFLGGSFMAVANWFRPMGIVFLVAMIICCLFKWRKSLKMGIGYVAMITIIGCATIHRTGLFLYQAKTGWMALMDYSSNHATESMTVRDHTEWNVAQKDSTWQSLFFDWLKDHPTEYVKQMPTKLVNTYVSDNVNMCTFIPDKADKEYMYEEVSMQTLFDRFLMYSPVQWLTIVNLIIYLSIIVTALCSLLYFNYSKYLLPVSIIIIGTLVLLLVGHGEARFHIPFMPFFIMLSALFINKKLWKG